MGDYIDTVSNPEFNDNNVSLAEFLLQFRRNHSENSKIVPKLEIPKGKKLKGVKVIADSKTLTISFGKDKGSLSSIIADRKPTSVVFAPVIEYNNNLYYVESSEVFSGTTSITYTKTYKLGNNNNFLEYNANESASEINSVIGKKTKKPVEQSKEEDISEPDDAVSSSRSDEETNYDKYQGEFTDKEIRWLFNEEGGPLAKYTSEIRDIAENEGEAAANSRTAELIEKVAKDPKVSEKIKDKMLEILKKFCSRK
jgi:hypothetical protein